MSYYTDIVEATATALLEFGAVQEERLQKFRTITGQVAGFKIKNIGLEEPLQISEIYDCSEGDAVIVGAVAVAPGVDLCGGFFTSGVFCNANPLDEDKTFYRVDYI